MKKRIGAPNWRRVHYLSFLAFLGATVHGLMAGSDTQAAWVFLGYLVMTAIVVFLFVYRIVLAVAAKRAADAAASAPAARARPDHVLEPRTSAR